MAKSKIVSPEQIKFANNAVPRRRLKKPKQKSAGHPYLKLSFLLLIVVIIATIIIAKQNAARTPQESIQATEPEPEPELEIIAPPKLEVPTTGVLCKDTDNGKTYGIKGICRDAYDGKIVEDQCINDDSLLEAECVAEQQCGAVQISCKSFGKMCIDGACI